jgi:hypothetical protein
MLGVVARRNMLKAAVCVAAGLGAMQSSLSLEVGLWAKADDGRRPPGTGSSIPLIITFVAGSGPSWQIDRIGAVKGDCVSLAPRLSIVEGTHPVKGAADAWLLRGTTINLRYSSKVQASALAGAREDLGKSQKTRAP